MGALRGTYDDLVKSCRLGAKNETLSDGRGNGTFDFTIKKHDFFVFQTQINISCKKYIIV